MTLEIAEFARLQAENDTLRAQLHEAEAARSHDVRIHESSQRVQIALAAGAIIGTWNWHPTKDSFTIDEGFARAFGLDVELTHVELTIDQVLVNVHPEDRSGLEIAIAEAIERGGAYSREYRVRRSDGEYHWIEAVGRVDYDPDGVPSSFPGIVIDVDDRRSLEAERNRATEALRESEARVRAMVEQSSAGIAQTTLDGRFTFVNDRYCSMLGRSREELLTLRMHDLTHPDDLPMNASQFQDLANGGASFDVEKRYLRPNGTLIWVRNSVTGVREADGKIESLFAVSVDITEQKHVAARQSFLLSLTDQLRTEDAPGDIMAATADLLGRHLSVSRVGYGLVQPDDRTIVFDRSFVKGVAPLTGRHALADFDEDSIAAQRRGETVVVRDTRSFANAANWAAIDTGSFVAVPRIRDGRFRASFYVNYRGPHDWRADEVALIEDVARRTWDAVERAQAESALRDAYETLEQRIATAVEERHKVEEALRQAQKMEAVGQLTGGLAHDFNNLLAGISGSLEMIHARIQQGRVAEIERYMVGAQGATRRAAALTHRLLAFSRRQTLDPKPTDVNRLIAGMEEMIQRTVGPQIKVESVAKGGLWSTLVDPPQLESALLNLCINARDAIPDGGKITIETANRWLDERSARERDLEPGQYVSMCVSDTGTGMTRDVIERAFDPFFTTKPIGVGTGLGLSMIYGFTRQSGGQARIYSEVGQGTMVCLYLPRHDVEEAAEIDITTTLVPSGNQNKTVLVVDDEPLVRMLVVDAVEDLGYMTLEAGDGPQALKILRSDATIDLLISDVGLPNGMNGRQVADAARELRPGLKVMFVTGYAENAVLSHGHLDPGMQVVTKPFDMKLLSNRIEGMMGG